MSLRPHRAPVNTELLCQRVHAHALRAGCSHSVHFLVGETCSRSFLWFRRRADQRVIGPVVGLGILADALIPCGNQPLDPWSPVPASFHCAHRMNAEETTEGWSLLHFRVVCRYLTLTTGNRHSSLSAGSYSWALPWCFDQDWDVSRPRTPVWASRANRSGTPQCSTICPSMTRATSITVKSTSQPVGGPKNGPVLVPCP